MQPLQVLAFTMKESYVRAKELVAGTDQKIAIQSPHVDRPMRGIVNGIDISEGARCMRQSHNLLHIVDCSHCVRSVANCYQLGVAVDFLCQVAHVEGTVRLVDSYTANRYTQFLKRIPWRKVGVVIE